MVFLDELIITQHVKYFSVFFMEPTYQTVRSQKLTTRPYPEPDKCGYPSPSTPSSPKWPSPVKYSIKTYDPETFTEFFCFHVAYQITKYLFFH